MSGKNKEVLIVYAHHNTKSLNAAILDITVQALTRDGSHVVVSDLYTQHFDPVIGFQDIVEEEKEIADGYSYSKSVSAAYKAGTLRDDIKEEHAKVRKADLIIFQFPLFWGSVPAILKGWFDRILTPGFAYDDSNGSFYDKGLLRGKKAILSFTVASGIKAFSPEGVNGDINVILHPIHRCALQFCGLEVLAPHMMHAVGKEGIEKALQAWTERVPKLWTEEQIPMLNLDQFDATKGCTLRDDSVLRKCEKAPSVGTHCGKPLV